MKTPTHWKDCNLISNILLPLGKIYGLMTRLRLKYKPSHKTDCPVICIGNLTAGGTGKTPVSISFAQLLGDLGYHPYFVTRGYGGTLHNTLVDRTQHSAAQTGDEPLLLSRFAPVVVNPNRFAAAQKAQDHGADIIIMDDGFQNPGLRKDLSFLVFDGNYGIGNGRCIPSGPLREEFNSGLKRADAIIIMGDDHQQIAQKTDLPCFHAEIKAIKPQISNPHIIAFAGIGRPEKFYNSLRQFKFNILRTFDFPDHHYYTEDELHSLIHKAESRQADIYTTSKDFVKIPPELQNKFKVLEIEVAWQDQAALLDFLRQKLPNRT